MPLAISNLTSIFRSGINMHNYGAIVSNARNRVIGSVPKDLLFATARNLQKGGYKQTISEINLAYEEASVALKKIEKFERNALESVPVNVKNFKKMKNDTKFIDFCLNNDKIFEEAQTESLLEAESSLMARLLPAMPDLKNVILTPIGEGNFKRVYKLEFKFANPNKTVAPQAIGVYRETPLSIDASNMQLRFLDNISDEAFAKVTKCSMSNVAQNKAERYAEILEQLDAVKKINYGEQGHGAMGEANTAEYIKHRTRHRLKPEDGIVLPDMFCLNDSSQFFVSKYVGKECKAKNPFDYNALGLTYTDAEINMSSEDDIIRDLGGFVSLTGSKPSAIVGSTIGTKISRQFAGLKTDAEKYKYLSNLRNKALKEKNLLNRYYMLGALNEIIATGRF